MRSISKIVLIAILINITNCNQKPKYYHQDIEPYVGFIKEQNTRAKDYILDLFDDHDIVIIGERFHPELTQYELILEIAKDPRFIDSVGNIFIEVCSRNQESNVHEYLTSKHLNEKQADSLLLHINRNNSVHPITIRYNFPFFFKGLRTLNNELENNNKIRLYPSDVPIHWSQITAEKYRTFWDNTISKRDSLMADYTIRKFDSIENSSGTRKKALVIQNYRHAFGHQFMYPNNEKPDNVGRFLFEAYPGRVANVLLNTITWDENENYTPVSDGKWDAAFKVTGVDNIGFDFRGSPFGADYFDLWPWEKHNFNYTDVFNGYVQYKQVEDFKMVNGIENLIDSTFLAEVRRRKELVKTARNLNGIITDSLIWDYNNVKVSPVSDSIEIKINKWIK
ncbi:hypothetical protein [Ascidiimonas aurantiaca]|uniref:hypothetical protein n=1 Tax=Ascidiimonas aurantiaca TaxID=1685432 RepID=UPI0030EE8B65